MEALWLPRADDCEGTPVEPKYNDEPLIHHAILPFASFLELTMTAAFAPVFLFWNGQANDSDWTHSEHRPLSSVSRMSPCDSYRAFRPVPCLLPQCWSGPCSPKDIAQVYGSYPIKVSWDI